MMTPGSGAGAIWCDKVSVGDKEVCTVHRKVDVRLHGKGNSHPHGAGPVCYHHLKDKVESDQLVVKEELPLSLHGSGESVHGRARRCPTMVHVSNQCERSALSTATGRSGSCRPASHHSGTYQVLIVSCVPCSLDIVLWVRVGD